VKSALRLAIGLNAEFSLQRKPVTIAVREQPVQMPKQHLLLILVAKAMSFSPTLLVALGVF
jgi:hypothetical protein